MALGRWVIALVTGVLGAAVGAAPASAATDPAQTLAERYAPVVVVREQALGARDGLRVTTRETDAVLTAALVLVATGALTGSVVLVPVAAWLLGRYGVAPAVAVIEGGSVGSSVRRSAELTRGRRWRTLALLAALLVIGTGIAGVLGAVLLLATSWPFWIIGLLSLLSLLVLLPAAFAGIALQYYDLRRRSYADTGEPVMAG